jgi:hypothetical protein
MPLLLRETSVSVQAFYPHCSFEAVKMPLRRAFRFGRSFSIPRGRFPVKGQIGQQRCRPVSGTYLGLFASKPADSFGRLKDLRGCWPW